jgi:hypothetical protein
VIGSNFAVISAISILGMSLKKAGKVVFCPRCQAELKVPRPSSEGRKEPGPDSKMKSLLVLMALPMAFIAGLLIGHFLWKSP